MPLYKQPGSQIWWLSLSHNGARVRESTGSADRKEAQRIHDERKVALWKLEPKTRGKTWGMAVDLWCDAAERSQSELLSLKKFASLYSDRELRKVTRESLRNVLESFCRTPGTYMRYRAMLTAILNAAKREGWLREVPVLPTKTTRKVKSRDWLTREQWAKLYAELPAHMKPMAAFSIETGLRQANVLGLEWSRVDLKRKLVWVEGEDTKSGEAISVPLSKGALDVLQSVQGQHPQFVFTFRGKPVKEIKTAFLAACCRAGVGSRIDDGRYAGFTWHGLRHTWATWHVQSGTPLDVLQKLGGWNDERMVRHYAHHSPGYLASFVNNTRRVK